MNNKTRTVIINIATGVILGCLLAIVLAITVKLVGWIAGF